MENKTIRVALFYDNRVGHLKQTDGILNALSKLKKTKVVKVEKIVPSFKNDIKDIFKYIFTLLANRGSSKELDIIIGTGAHTHIPMLILKKKMGGRIVTCMTPNFPVKYFIDICFIPEQKNPPKRKNIFTTIGAPNLCTFRKDKDRSKGLILIGGEDKSHIWDSSYVLKKVEKIVKKEKDVHWSIASSRRTPKECIALFQELASKISNVTFFKSEDTEKEWLEKKYAECLKVWITSDSNSMTYEAITAGCSVGIIFIKWKKKNNSFKRSLDYLTKKGYIVNFDDWDKDSKMPKGFELNESKRCAETILKVFNL